jgi:hypothetical protein
LTLAPIGYERLTIITCWPFPANDSHRMVLFGSLRQVEML